MTALGHCTTDVSDMYAVHKALTGALDAAPAYVAKARLDSQRVEVIDRGPGFDAFASPEPEHGGLGLYFMPRG